MGMIGVPVRYPVYLLSFLVLSVIGELTVEQNMLLPAPSYLPTWTNAHRTKSTAIHSSREERVPGIAIGV